MNRTCSLHWCNHCKESSVRVKCYTDKKGERKRAMYCINKGCGYKQALPFPVKHYV